MPSETSKPTVLDRLPKGIRYPIHGSMPFMVLAIICGTIYLFIQYVSLLAFICIVGTAIGYWVLYAIGESFERESKKVDWYD